MENNQKSSLAEKWGEMTRSASFPRLIITIFFTLICLLAIMQGLPFLPLLSDSLVRFGMNAILVLAMVPAIQCGIGPNFGLPIGILTGLLGTILSFQMGYTGWAGFAMAIVLALPFTIIAGVLYGLMLNRVKGSEMIVSTYTGFSVVSLMSIGWILIPFTDTRMAWPLGRGLRNVISLDDTFGKLLNDALSIKFLRELSTGKIITLFNKTGNYVLNNYSTEQYHTVFSIPTAMLIFVALVCLLVWLFTKSRSGVMLKAAGDNPRFAEASGINVNYYRVVGTAMSTVLGAVGIIVFSQSYGFMQLYQAPLMAAFPAVAAVLIGGATAKRATIIHVIIGAFLFQGLLTIALPVANSILTEGNLSEIIRQVVQNGVILYALTQVGGGN